MIRNTCWVRAILLGLISIVSFLQLHSSFLHDDGTRVADASFVAPKQRQGSVSNVAGHGGISNKATSTPRPTVLPAGTKPPTTGRFAYAALVAGCNPDTSNYRAFIYNVLVSAHVLQTTGSVADFIVMIRMKGDSNYTKLPDDEELVFQRAGVIIQYLPKVKADNFYSAMLAKFAILEFTQYDRILFMDADVIALCNLDYLFDASMSGMLRENVVLAWQNEPANGGFFILQPGQKDQLDAIVKRQYDRRIREQLFFNESWGWGNPIEAPDYWIDAKLHHHTQWLFTAAFADQGLLYHWVKYHRRSVSIILGGRIEEWVNGTVKVEPNHLPRCLGEAGPHSFRKGTRRDRRFRFAPSRDFIHFTGSGKPWLATSVPKDVPHLQAVNQSISLWFYYFRRMRVKWNLNVTDEEVIQLGLAPLGGAPTKTQARAHTTQKDNILEGAMLGERRADTLPNARLTFPADQLN
jgi:hypothetical protein